MVVGRARWRIWWDMPRVLPPWLVAEPPQPPDSCLQCDNPAATEHQYPQAERKPNSSKRSFTRGSYYLNVIFIFASWVADKVSPGHTEFEPVVSGAINVTPPCFH